MLNHRIYATTTRDFVTFTPTTLLFDPGFSVIDATILTTPGTVYLVFKDETRTPPKKHLRLAAADRIEGPYAIVSEPFTPSGVWVEGPSVVKIGEFYYCYFDMYQARRYGAMRSTDLKTWEDVTARLRFTVDDVRHGTAFTVGADDLSRLMSGGSR
jgi:hypothetical protein